MADITLFALGHERVRWLSARVLTIGANVANADTPGYKAQDVSAFSGALDSARLSMQRTRSSHLEAVPGPAGNYDVVPRPSGETKHSGNTVSLEAEMALLGEARGQQAAVTGVLGAFHRMLLSSVKA